VNLTVGAVALALGVAMLWMGLPRGGVSPAFMRNGLVELFYPVGCLLALVVGAAGVLSGLPWAWP
jgi:hypothetical protein